ncbi:hypothetical protein K6U44_14340 [Vibrio parahaemolyticus]|uniref:hypothetical protein n=1 Tax=Vibrio parahaemolyticus TaxID=670 RepID=UPI001EEAF76F|nr:hypothetical protein [Vibrio parahaemolyticus]MCG6461604.1 hypothetical protein [Vibrio parahaemolyticus]
MKNNEHTTAFFGFINDYEALELSELIENKIITHYQPPTFLIKIYSASKRYKIPFLERLCILYAKKMLGINHKNYVFDDHDLSIDVLKASNLDEEKVNVVFRNIVKNSTTVDGIREHYNCNLYSFDRNDCEKYGMIFYVQFCSGFSVLNIMEVKHTYTFDLYFLGRDKNRKDLIREIINFVKLDNNFIKIIPDRSKEYIAYSEHLNKMTSSKIVIDIVQAGQVGITMRTAEALLLGKKIITNNLSILDSEFYHKDNIFLYKSGESKYSDFLSFYKSKNVTIPDEILYKLNPSYFYEKICN